MLQNTNKLESLFWSLQIDKIDLEEENAELHSQIRMLKSELNESKIFSLILTDNVDIYQQKIDELTSEIKRLRSSPPEMQIGNPLNLNSVLLFAIKSLEAKFYFSIVF